MKLIRFRSYLRVARLLIVATPPIDPSTLGIQDSWRYTPQFCRARDFESQSSRGSKRITSQRPKFSLFVCLMEYSKHYIY